MRAVLLLPLLLVPFAFTATAGAATSGCPALAAPAGTTQLVVVRAPAARSTTGTLQLWAKTGGCWRAASPVWSARLGRNGVSAHHREGDGTTPLGTFAFGRTVYGIDANPGVRYAYHRLVCGDWWDEDPTTAAYNRFAHVPCGTTPPFGGGSEALWTEAPAYTHFAVVRYNDAPVVPGRGSAIFLHADTGGPTNGCISLPLGQLDAVLRWLRPADRPQIRIEL